MGPPGPQGGTGPQGPQGPAGVVTANAPLSLTGTTLSIDLSAYAPLASPTFTGNPQAPTPTAGDNDTSIATTAFVVTKAGNYLPLTGGILTGNLTISSAGALIVQSTTDSTSSSTGALTVAGGLGVGGAINASSDITSYRAATPTTGAYFFGNTTQKYLYFDGTKFQFSNDPVNIFNATASTSVTTGALTVGGGVGIGGVINAAGVNVKPSAGDPVASFYRGGILQSYLTDNGNAIWVFSNAGGTAGMYILHGASAWTAISDARLPYKKTARPLSALDKLEHIALYENEIDGRLELFGKAQEIYEAFPHVVIKGDDDLDFTPTGMPDGKIWGVSYERLGLVALQACKELLAQVKLLEDRIAVLEAG
jgi:hypothetical protein